MHIAKWIKEVLNEGVQLPKRYLLHKNQNKQECILGRKIDFQKKKEWLNAIGGWKTSNMKPTTILYNS